MDVTSPKLNQKTAEGKGSAHGLPGGQGHDKPLVDVGTYGQPGNPVDVGSIMSSDNDGQADKAVSNKGNTKPPYLK